MERPQSVNTDPKLICFVFAAKENIIVWQKWKNPANLAIFLIFLIFLIFFFFFFNHFIKNVYRPESIPLPLASLCKIHYMIYFSHQKETFFNEPQKMNSLKQLFFKTFSGLLLMSVFHKNLLSKIFCSFSLCSDLLLRFNQSSWRRCASLQHVPPVELTSHSLSEADPGRPRPTQESERSCV